MNFLKTISGMLTGGWLRREKPEPVKEYTWGGQSVVFPPDVAEDDRRDLMESLLGKDPGKGSK